MSPPSTTTSKMEISKEDTTKSSRHKTTANFRSIRRSLQDITPENSLPQLQSPLFSLLPSEIRMLIFAHVLSQSQGSHQNLRGQLGRPGHTHHTEISTSLLRTCRLIYYEANAIPLRSTTHHIDPEPSSSYKPSDWDHYVYHLSKQSGKNLYHLHITTSTEISSFTTFLLPHLHWRKLTWTLCISEWSRIQLDFYELNLAETIAAVRFPSSCREINLEYETLIKIPRQRQVMRWCADKCRAVTLTRSDGSVLDVDDEYSCEYTWEGETWVPARTGLEGGQHGEYVKALYHVIRICWREKVNEREYTSWDRLDCLKSKEMVRWTKDEVEKDTEAAAAATARWYGG